MEKAEALGRPLEVAIVIGPDPVVWLEGGMPDRLVPEDIDELGVKKENIYKSIGKIYRQNYLRSG